MNVRFIFEIIFNRNVITEFGLKRHQYLKGNIIKTYIHTEMDLDRRELIRINAIQR